LNGLAYVRFSTVIGSSKTIIRVVIDMGNLMISRGVLEFPNQSAEASIAGLQNETGPKGAGFALVPGVDHPKNSQM
jgi:hypothetical protein